MFLLTIPLCHRLNKVAPLSRHFGGSPHSELVQRAAVECRHIFGGLDPIICVHPRVRAPLADCLVLNDVFNDASIGVVRGLPSHLDGWYWQRQSLDVAWRWRTWEEKKKKNHNSGRIEFKGLILAVYSGKRWITITVAAINLNPSLKLLINLVGRESQQGPNKT